MAKNDLPITRLSSLELNREVGVPNPMFAPPVLTTAEINAIPLDDLRAGGIVYNITVGSLQTYTINGWENFAIAGEDSNPTFENITVTDTATIENIEAVDIVASNDIATANANMTAAGNINGVILDVAGNIYSGNTIFGKRPSGSIHFFNNATTFVYTSGQPQLNLATTADYLNYFSSDNLSTLTYLGQGLAQSPITVMVNFSFYGRLSATGEFSFDFFKNGNPLSRSAATTFTSGTFNSVTRSFITTMVANDTIQIRVSGTPGTLSFMNYDMVITEI